MKWASFSTVTCRTASGLVANAQVVKIPATVPAGLTLNSIDVSEPSSVKSYTTLWVFLAVSASSLTSSMSVISLSTAGRSSVSGRSWGRPAASRAASVGTAPGRSRAVWVSRDASASRYWRTKPPALYTSRLSEPMAAARAAPSRARTTQTAMAARA